MRGHTPLIREHASIGGLESSDCTASSAPLHARWAPSKGFIKGGGGGGGVEGTDFLKIR